MSRTMCAVIAVVALGGGEGLLSGCTDNPLYCATNADCTDPAKPYCDVAGEYGEMIGHSCVADPFAVVDGGVDGPNATIDSSVIDGSEPDAGIDGSIDEPDGAVDGQPDAGVLARIDQISLVEVKVTNDLGPIGLPNGLSGARVTISFTNPVQDTGVTIGDGSVGTCVIKTYDLTANPPQHPAPPLSEGALTISGTLQAIGDCFDVNGQEGYICEPRGGGIFSSNGSVAPFQGSLMTVTESAAGFDTALVGQFVKLGGFANAANNGTFPIMSQSGSSLIVINPGAVSEGAAGNTYEFRSGAGPTPANAAVLNATSNVTIAKEAGTEYGPFSILLGSSGEGFDLDNASALPHQLPGSPGDVVFSCGGTGGSCGNTGEGGVTGLAISGRTTDATIPTGQPPFAMPAPVQHFATFSCTSLGATSITLPEEVLAALLSTGATRIETTVAAVTGTLVQGENGGQLRIAVGHALVGFSTF